MNFSTIVQCCIKYFIKICKHKYYVGRECFKRGLYWQGITHDLSKFSWTEFVPSAIYFENGLLRCEDKEINQKYKRNYDLAWLHHKAKNKHHWEYWVDFIDGEPISIDIPDKYIQEMACDMIGASIVYNPNSFDKGEPLRYYYSNLFNPKMTVCSLDKLRYILEEYAR